MRIDQRNAGASVTLAAGGNYTLDRMRVYSSGSSVLSVQQSSDTPSGQGFSNSILITSLAATTPASTDYYFFDHRIEGYNIANLGFGTASAKTITLSFWIKSSLTGQFGGSLTNNAQDRSYPFSYTISSANTWEKKTITIAGETSGTWLTDNGRGLRCRLLDLGTGSTYIGTANSWQNADYYGVTGDVKLINTNGATVYLTGVQLEVGSTATDFENLPYDVQLARCQRYFQMFDGINCIDGQFYSSSVARFHVQLSPDMRTAPSGSWSGTLTASVEEVGVAFRDPTGYSVNAGSSRAYSFNGTGMSGATASKQAMFRGNLIALSLSAEL